MIGLGNRVDKVKMEFQLNTIIIAVKWRLHADKQMGLSTSFFQVLLQIKRTIDTLKFIAAKNHRAEQFHQLWEIIVNSLKS
jgi:hypothetical protein